MINQIFMGFFVAIGVLVFAALCSLLADIYEQITYHIRKKIVRRKEKKRFKRAPKAECYCIDCVHWYRDEEARQSGYCAYDGQHASEDYFCKYASIRKEKK